MASHHLHHLHNRPCFSATAATSTVDVVPVQWLAIVVLRLAVAVLATVLAVLPRPSSPLYSSLRPSSLLRSFSCSFLLQSCPRHGTPCYRLPGVRSHPRCRPPCRPFCLCPPQRGNSYLGPPCGGCPRRGPVGLSLVLRIAVLLTAAALAAVLLVFLLAAVLSASPPPMPQSYLFGCCVQLLIVGKDHDHTICIMIRSSPQFSLPWSSTFVLS